MFAELLPEANEALHDVKVAVYVSEVMLCKLQALLGVANWKEY
jgi:hypothetical protein